MLCEMDSSLSHAHPVCVECCTVYCIAIAQLLSYPRNREAAYMRACAYAQEHCCADVVAWLAIAKDAAQFVPFGPQSGWIKIGFIYAFRCLLLARNPEQAIIATVSGGGDTDTNAAIVGGLIGAVCGWSAFPAR